MLRRDFLKNLALSAPLFSCMNFVKNNDLFFDIGLAQWSFNGALKSGVMNNLDFALVAKEKFNITTVEYVNQFFFDKANDKKYLGEMLKRTEDNGIRNYLIMIDDEGDLGDTDKNKRNLSVDNHKKWVEAAKFLGCDHIRVNAQGYGSEEEVSKNASESLSALGEFSEPYGIDIIVENHGGYSSDANWLVNVIKNTGKKNVGTLPDFGNFCVKKNQNLSDWGATSDECSYEYDKYLGVKQMLPYARSISAKSYSFDNNGNSIEIDYYRMLKIIKDSGYNGYISIEYEGDGHSEEEGIKLTQELLVRAGSSI
tara:strand:+ start:271 stop:1203 length:933 start_codon:yes stop_codon:yes gene_type:complete